MIVCVFLPLCRFDLQLLSVFIELCLYLYILLHVCVFIERDEQMSWNPSCTLFPLHAMTACLPFWAILLTNKQTDRPGIQHKLHAEWITWTTSHRLMLVLCQVKIHIWTPPRHQYSSTVTHTQQWKLKTPWNTLQLQHWIFNNY